MSYIVITRNPNSKVLNPIEDNTIDEDFPPICEYNSYEEADAAANNCSACVAWGYEVLEIGI